MKVTFNSSSFRINTLPRSPLPEYGSPTSPRATNASPNPLYVEKNTSYVIRHKTYTIHPTLFQPTPMGTATLCAHYSNKYAINLTSLDLETKVEAADNAFNFFSYLQENEYYLDIEEGKTKGIVLSHGQFHAIPVLLCKKDGIKHLMVFDSTSGPRVKGYYKMANLFPDFQFYLNAGTRQADEGSCITDAVCILKEALQIKNLVHIIKNKRFIPLDLLRATIFSSSMPKNFHVFRMPEQLLLTAQIAKYLNDANLDTVIRGGQTLRHYRETYVMSVSFIKGIVNTANINSYLYIKACEHKDLLDLYWSKANQQTTFSPDQMLLVDAAPHFVPISPQFEDETPIRASLLPSLSR